MHVHWLTTADLIAWGEPVPVDCAIEGVQHRLTRTRVLHSVNENILNASLADLARSHLHTRQDTDDNELGLWYLREEEAIVLQVK